MDSNMLDPVVNDEPTIDYSGLHSVLSQPTPGIPTNVDEVAAIAAYSHSLEKGTPFQDAMALYRQEFGTYGTTRHRDSVAEEESKAMYETIQQSFSSFSQENPTLAAGLVVEAKSIADGKRDSGAMERKALEYASLADMTSADWKYDEGSGGMKLPAIDKAAYQYSLGNIFKQKLADAEAGDKRSMAGKLMDVLGIIGQSLIPIEGNRTDMLQDVAEKVTGANYGFGDTFDARTWRRDITKFFATLPADMRESFVNDLDEALKKEAGTSLFGTENKTQYLDFLATLSDLSNETNVDDHNLEATLNTVFPVIGYGDAITITGKIATAVKTTALDALVLAGSKKAAAQIVSDATKGTEAAYNLSGLTKEDAIRMSFSNGTPLDYTGLSADVVESIRKETALVLKNLESVSPTTLTDVQKLQEAEAVVKKYQDIDKSIVRMTVESVDDDGMTLTVERRNQYTGKDFASVEDAHTYAKEHGITGYEVVPSTSVDDGVKAGPKVSGPSYDLKKEAQGLHGSPTKLFAKDTTVVSPDGKRSVVVPKNIEVSGNITPEYANGLASVMKLLGMKRNIMLVHEDDLASVAALGDDWAATVKRITDKPEYFKNSGWHSVLTSDDNTSIILLNRVSFDKTLVPKTHAAFTLAHEVGHAFVHEFLEDSASSTAMWAKLFDEFDVWKSSKKTTSTEFKATHYPPQKLKAESKFLLQEQATTAATMLKRLEAQGDDWLGDFHEFFSEQLAKHVLGKEQVAHSFFTPIAKALKSAYEWAVKFYNKTLLGKPEAIPSIKEFLDKHIADVKNGITPDYIKSLMLNMADYGAQANKSVLQRGKARVKRMMESRKSRISMSGEASPLAGKGYTILQKGHREPYLFTNIGEHDTASIKGASWFGVLDPKQKVTEYTYENSLISMFATDKEKAQLTNFFKQATKGLSLKQQRKVWDVLAEIDAKSNAGNSLENLKIDVSYLRSLGLDDRQIKLYDRVRTLRDYTWARHNEYLVRELKRQGYTRKLVLKNEALGEVEMPVVVYTENSGLKAMVGRGDIRAVHLADTGKNMTLTNGEQIDKLLADGYTIVKMRDDIKGVRHVALRGENHKLADLGNVLPYRPHEFSRVYSDKYFITKSGKRMVDGVEVESKSAFRTATSSREASMYVADVTKANTIAKQLRDGVIGRATAKDSIGAIMGKWKKSGEEYLEAVEKGDIDIDAVYTYHYDRAPEDVATSLVDEHISSGRMFESKRGGKLLSVQEDRVNTVSPVESLGLEMAIVSRRANLTEWRAATIKKWLNTFVDKTKRTGNDIEDFMNAPVRYSEGSKEFAVAKHEKDYITSMISGRSQDERVLAARARGVVEWMENRPGVAGVVAEKVFSGMQFRQANPLQFLRTINYHLTLGLFNPSQLLVQSIGMMNAVYVHPVHGLKSALSASPIRIALMSDNPEVWRKVAGISKALPPDEFVKVVQSIRKSGIIDSVKNTAFYNNADGFDNMFKEYGKGAFNKYSTTFFDRGEEFSRITSWEVARREWIAANPKLDWTTNEALAAITSRMDDFTLGMTRANVANYQRGLLSVPFQFLQYNIKFATELMRAGMGGSRVFTQTDAAKILVGNLIMWGTAGNGLRGMGDEWFAEKMGLEEEGKLAITQGAVASLINYLSEAKLAIGTRFGSLVWYRDTLANIASGELDLPDLMFGISKSNFVKGVDVMRDVASIWHTNPSLSAEKVQESLLVLGKMASGMNNATKAWILTHNGGLVYNKTGDLLTRVNQQEAIAQLFGIQTSEIPDYYRQIDLIQSNSKQLQEIAKYVKKLQHMELEAIADGDYDVATSYAGARQLLLTEDPLKRDRILQMVKEQWKSETLPEGVYNKLIDRGLSDVTTTSRNRGE